QSLRFGQLRLSVANADLDRGIGEVRTDAPPELRVLVDRPGVVEEADVVLEPPPAVVRVGDAGARKHLREDLRAYGVQTGRAVLDERGARRQRQQLGQD